ncbi:hypothetical protein MLD63_04555 [Paracoccus sp. TK19116]|uniref:GlsB/YeaQ/YmgE family stress response membrane protein n=1 Tax=Paracoccus albicereus TaxID=2922394 RepID=A0ABT1MN49_9RHOB|nr:hypothetical protein [Paracoccus albicereus]MCQ0969697.1 hypothetical protein [Paracoccus albicereus]
MAAMLIGGIVGGVLMALAVILAGFGPLAGFLGYVVGGSATLLLIATAAALRPFLRLR